MKIVCDACQAKYSIADEKIQGKAFKIRCKKCNHIIVVKVGEGDAAAHAAQAPASAPAAAAPASAAVAEKPKASAAAASASAPAGEQAVWHVVIDGEQVGPITDAEVKERLSQGKINSDTLVWKDGLGDWAALSAVPELAALYAKVALAAKPASARSGSSGMAKGSTSPVPASRPSATHAVAAKPAAQADVFSAPNAGGGGSLFVSAAPTVLDQPAAAGGPSSAFLFGASPAAQPAPEPQVVIKNPGNGAGTHLTGQRNENSVLFSLSNLEALAMPSQSAGVRPPSGTSNTEGSGLIDIRSMAAMTIGDSHEPRRTADSLPTFSTPQFSPVAPVILPLASSGPPKWVYPVLGLVGVGILFVSYALFKVLGAPPPSAVPMVVAPAPAPVAAPVTTPPAATEPAPAAAEAKPATPPAATATAEEKPAEKAKSGKGDKGRKRGSDGEKSRSSGESKKPEVAAAPTPAPAPPAPSAAGKPSGGKSGGKSLDDLLGEVGNKKRGGGDDSSSKSSGGSASSAKLVSLTQSDIVNAMKGVQPKVQACANQFKVAGTAMATISVASGGRINSATVTGKFAGTPTGSCVEQAAKSAKLPPCQAMNFPWPFTLTPR